MKLLAVLLALALVAPVVAGSIGGGPNPGSGTTATVTETAAESAAVTAGFSYVQGQQRILDPFYIFPGDPWTEFLKMSPGALAIAVINPASGPDTAPNPSYEAQIIAAHARGCAIIGYVHTRVTPGGVLRPIQDLLDEIDDYYSFYPSTTSGMDGIFFDEAFNNLASVPFYQQLYAYVKAKTTGRRIVVINPGTQTIEEYMTTCDIVCNQEDVAANYAAFTPSPWVFKYPAYRFFHIAHTASPGDMRNVVQLSRGKNAGWLFITDDSGANPFDANPTYLVDECAEVTGLGNSSRVVAELTTQVTVSAVNTDTTIGVTCTIPANTLIVARELELEAGFKYSLNSTDTIQFKLKSNATTLFSSNAISTGTGPTNRDGHLKLSFACRAVGGSGSIQVSGPLFLQGPTGGTFFVGPTDFNGVTVSTLIDQVLSMTVVYSTTNAGNITMLRTQKWRVLN